MRQNVFVDLQGRTGRSVLTANGIRENKIVVVGPRGVGKSALVVRYLTKRFINEYVENTDMLYIRAKEVDGTPVRVNIQDTSDRGMRPSYVEHQFRWADAIMMVYSITDHDSFSRLKDTASGIVKKMMEVEDKEQRRIPPLVVVGNKGDLDYVRKVSRQEGFELATKLKCEFYEASAREGWSKLLTRKDVASGNQSPSGDTINIFAGTTASVGFVGLPHTSVTQEFPRSGSPLIPRRRFSDRADVDFFLPSESLWEKRGNLNTLKQKERRARSNSIVSSASQFQRSANPKLNGLTAPTCQQSLPSSPAFSEDDSDGPRSANLSSQSKNGRYGSFHGGLIGRLSPRLSRKLYNKGPKVNENSLKSGFRDNNNNKGKNRIPMNNIASGLSVTLSASAKLGEHLSSGFSNDPISTNNSNSGSNTSENSSDSSSTGSTESLADVGLDNGDNARRTSLNPPQSLPLIKEPYMEVKLQEREFSSSEPFLHLCRVTMKERTRSRSPSRKLMSGLKRIRSFGSELNQQANQTNSLNKPTITNALLSVSNIQL